MTEQQQGGMDVPEAAERRRRIRAVALSIAFSVACSLIATAIATSLKKREDAPKAASVSGSATSGE